MVEADLPSRIVIVGAGQAGGRTAQALRRNGHAGPITLIGDENLPPYERPPLSKDILLGRASPESLSLLKEAAWQALDVDLRCGASVSAIHPATRTVSLDDGSEIDYDVLVCATGARARSFPGAVQSGTELLQLRNLADAQRLKPRLAPGQRIGIIGAGFIGMELASSARQLGADVVLIEGAVRPLARLLPAAFAAELVEIHRARGVEVVLDASVASLSPGRILLADGRAFSVDTIIVGIGARANDELAATAGLIVRDGIVVDAVGRSSDPAVYAVGDVARHVDLAAALDHRLESWRNAEDGALAVAAAICGMPVPDRRVPWFWTDQYGRNIQIAGKPGDDHVRIDRGDRAAGPSISYYLERGILRGAIAIDSARELRGAMKLMESGQAVEPDALAGHRSRARPAPQVLAAAEPAQS